MTGGLRAGSMLTPMYAQRFGLAREPFSIAPDPRFLFMSERHREALAHLLYGLQGGGGFVLLTGEIGAGKTTVCRAFLEQMPPHCNVAYIFNPRLSSVELLHSVCDEFHITGLPPAAQATVKDCLDPLNAFLLRAHAEGRNNVLIVDEAQNLSPRLLEQLRLLTNLETHERKLLQIILIGQPELRTMLAEPPLAALAQRVIARYHLEALSMAETAAYVRHRLSVAGLAGALPFDTAALRRLHELSGGVPRRINLLADRALLGTWGQDRERADRATVDQAAREVFGDRGGARRPVARRASLLIAGAAGLALGAGLWAAAAHWPGLADGTASAWAPALLRRSAASAAAAGDSATAATAATTATAATAPGAAGIVAGAVLAHRLPTLDPDPSAAWRALAALWPGAAAVDDPCAAGQPLRCHRGTAMTLAQIRQLDRPGLLTLEVSGSGAVPVLLRGLSRDRAWLQLGPGAPVAVPLPELAAQWRGDFATLWRLPPDAPADADTETHTRWLAARLAAAEASSAAASDSAPPGPPSRRQRIAAFQRAQGLPPDGRAGPLTLMQWNRAAGVDEPHLIQEP
jgi:general secretion pathway protein A